MRIALCHPQTPFSFGGAEMHTNALARSLESAGHEVDTVQVPFKWYPPTELIHQMALWRSLDLSEASGQRIDMIVALKFPAYLATHERKVVWLIHQHRTAYELWEHPAYADLSVHEDGDAVREVIQRADRLALGEARRLFASSENVRDRLQRSSGLLADVLYHRSPLSEELLTRASRGYGDYVLFPSRIESLKRQSLAVEAMKHVRSGVRLVLVGAGPGDEAIRRQIEQDGLGNRVQMTGRLPDEDLIDLYTGALAILYCPYDEDYGYVTLEALAAERPVVTTSDSGGPLELVRDGENGLIVEPDPRSIATVLDGLAEDRARAENLGMGARTTVQEKVPAWPEVVSRLLD